MAEGDTQPLLKGSCKNCKDRPARGGYETCCKTCARTSGERHGPFCEGHFHAQQQQRQEAGADGAEEAGEADETTRRRQRFHRSGSVKTFWKGEEVGEQGKLKSIMNQKIRDDALHIVFADALYLHKAIFEFDEGDCEKKRSEAIKKLNAMAFGLFNCTSSPDDDASGLNLDQHSTPDPLFGDQDEITEFVCWGCLQLLAASTDGFQQNVRVEIHHGSRSYHDYPFEPRKIDRFFHLAKLQRIWKSDNFLHVVPGILERLGPHRRMKLLSAMCVQVPKDELAWKEFHYFVKSCPVKLARGSWDHEKKISSSNPPQDVAAVNPIFPAWRIWFAQRHRSRVVVFYTEVQGALCRWNDIFLSCHKVDFTVVKFVKAVLASCDDNSHAQPCALPFTQAVAESLWDLVWPFFCWNRVMDIVFQVLLTLFITPASHNILVNFNSTTQTVTDQIMNETTENPVDSGLTYVGIETLHDAKFVLCVIVYLGSRTMFITIAEMISLIILYGKRQSSLNVLRNALTCWDPYRLVNVVIEVFSFWLMLQIAQDFIYNDYDEKRRTMIHEYPFRLTGLVFAKWCQVMLMIMNTYVFRETMLPAWNAVVGKTSMAFLVVLMSLSSGAAMAYYALPIGDTSQDTHWHWQEYLHPFFVMSRLNMMGDISSDILGGMEYPEESQKQFKWALSFFIIFCGVLFPVVALNLYVGVLSAAYEKEVKSLIHAEGFLHSTTACRLLLALRWYPLRCLMAPGKCCWRKCWCISVWSEHEEQGHNHEGTWIAIPEHRFDPEFDADHVDISDTLSIMRFKLEDPEQQRNSQKKLLQEELAQEGPPNRDILEAIRSLQEKMEDMQAELGSRIDSVQEAVSKLQKHHED